MKLFHGSIFPDVEIYAGEQNHILKVLRMREGENLSITDGKGNVAHGKLIIKGKLAAVEIETIEKDLPNFSKKLHLAICPTKNLDRIEFFVEKATEMGISEITLIQTEKTERKHLNLDKIIKKSVAASKQSLRFHFPKINPLVKLNDFLSKTEETEIYVAHCHENLSRISLSDLASKIGHDYCVLIGPEGDFSETEIQKLVAKNITGVSLGPQRLRTETAGIFLAAWNYSKMF